MSKLTTEANENSTVFIYTKPSNRFAEVCKSLPLQGILFRKYNDFSIKNMLFVLYWVYYYF